MSGLHIAVVLLAVANILQFIINTKVRQRLNVLEAETRAIKRGPDPVAIGDVISRSLVTAGGLGDE